MIKTHTVSLGMALLAKGKKNCVHYMMIVGEGRDAVGTCRKCGRKIDYGLIDLEKYGRRLKFGETEILGYDITMQKYGLGG